MSYADFVFKNICRDVCGDAKKNTPEHWSMSNSYDLQKEFPALTVKKTELKNVMDEILWIWQKKSSNVHDLNSHVWDAYADEHGYIKKAYGYQCKIKYPDAGITIEKLKIAFPDGIYKTDISPENGYTEAFVAIDKNGNIRRAYAIKIGSWMLDQVDSVIYKLKNTPFESCIMISFFNFFTPAEKPFYVPAYEIKFDVAEKSGQMVLNADLTQTTNGSLLANNLDLTRYAILLMMIAQACGMIPGKLVHRITDAYINAKDMDIMKELIEHEPFPAPIVKLNPAIHNFYDFTQNDLIIENYRAYS